MAHNCLKSPCRIIRPTCALTICCSLAYLAYLPHRMIGESIPSRSAIQMMFSLNAHCMCADQVAQPRKRQSVCQWSPCHVPTMCPSCSPSSPSSSRAVTLLRASAVLWSLVKACPWSDLASSCRYAACVRVSIALLHLLSTHCQLSCVGWLFVMLISGKHLGLLGH